MLLYFLQYAKIIMVMVLTDKQKRFEDLAQRSSERGYAVYSDFLGISEMSELFACRFPVPFKLWGGYEGSERCVACFGEREYFSDNTDYPINCILIEPVSQKFADELTHRDFLGSLMGLGIRREVLGDIIISENKGYLFCLDTISDYIIENLIQVKHTTVKCRIAEEIPQNAFPQPENIELIVSSERIDVIVAAVYNLSRSKALPYFEHERVFVNGRAEIRPSATANEGDKISVRGFGRFIYNGVFRRTKKDRFVISIDIFR